MTITEFLLARIAEDERLANAVDMLSAGVDRISTHSLPEFSDYQIRWQPAAVRAECKAKRAIIVESLEAPTEPMTDAEMHRLGAHPAYEYATTEGQRKSWDDVDRPPVGEGWERNTDMGRAGWDRLDYTEESYWRRPRPAGPRKPYVNRTLCALARVYADHHDYQEDWA